LSAATIASPDFSGVDPESIVRGHPALHGRDVRNQRRDLPSGTAIAVRGKTFGRVQDVAGQSAA
jgi:hypothetical protein